MKQLLLGKLACLILSALFLFVACEKDDPLAYYDSSSSVYSSSNQVCFSTITLFMKPYVMHEGVKKYIATEQIFNLEISVNEFWSKAFDSYTYDILRLNPQARTDDFYILDKPVPYAFEIDVAMVPEELVTAGDYAQLLNKYWNLQPGAYICRINSLDILTLSGEIRRIYTPTLVASLEIKEGVASVHLGEFEVEIK
ncbi:hypothetical protein LJB91_01455 [Bacteroidales bacterium OttesenSCG-928-L03]|nr:hypothetical protein [Bacteroidales bacterium OttesenSCG-928-L03]